MTDQQTKSMERLVTWMNMIGWKQIWNREHGPASVLQVGAFADFCFKCAVTCLLLIQYYSTVEKDVAWREWKDDVDRLYAL